MSLGLSKRLESPRQEQGYGVGGLIFSAIEDLAWRERLSRRALETGDRPPAAWRVYERAGFSRCGPFADCPESSYSVFYSKPLAPVPAAAATA